MLMFILGLTMGRGLQTGISATLNGTREEAGGAFPSYQEKIS